jgi:hypothetical protein
MPNQQHRNLKTKKTKKKKQEANNTNNQIKEQKCLPHPQTKMTHCPQCVQKYNARGTSQVKHNVRESSLKLEWQTLDLQNTKKKQKNKKTKTKTKKKTKKTKNKKNQKKKQTNKQDQITRKIIRVASHKR